MKIIRLISFIPLLYLCACGTQPTKDESGIANVLDSLIWAESEDHFNGTVVIGNDKEIFFQKAVGIANRTWDIPIQMDTRFDICSINKSFIAVLVLKAVEEGKLHLEDKLVDVLELQNYPAYLDTSINLHHLLTHTSGIPHYEAVDKSLSENNFKAFKRLHFKGADYADFILELKPRFFAGKGFYYSSLSYFLLAHILEKIYQQPFDVLLQEKICKPLGLKNTFSPSLNEKTYQHIAIGYNLQPNGEWHKNQFIDFSLGKRIFSSSENLYKWGMAMYDTTFLSEASRKLMLTNYLTDIQPNISYGYGWVVFDGKGDYKMGKIADDLKYIIHGGNTEGFKSMLVNINEGEFIIAFLSNSGDQTNELDLAKKIVKVLTTK